MKTNLAFNSLLRHLPGPLVALAAAAAVLYVIGRLDAAQTARLAELDTQQQVTLQHTRAVAQARNATRAASEAVDRRNSALRAAQAVEARKARTAQARADSLRGTVDSLLAGLDTATSGPIVSLIASQRDQIRALSALVDSKTEEADSLRADRDRWKAQAGAEAALAAEWQARAGAWEHEAKRGCLPLVGCVNRTVVFFVGAGAGALATTAVP